jgi:hypothetical protein
MKSLLINKLAKKLCSSTVAACIFMGSVSFAVHASETIPDSVTLDSAQTYPDLQQLEKLYQAIAADDPELLAPDPDINFLKDMYDYGVESGVIDPLTQSYSAFEQNIPPLEKFNIATANSFIIGDNGEIVGYSDEKFRSYDANGEYVGPWSVNQHQSTSLAKSTGQTSCPSGSGCVGDYIILYSGSSFSGTRVTYNGSGPNVGTAEKVITPAAFTFASAVIGPGVELTLGYTASGKALTKTYAYSSAPRYIGLLEGSITKITIKRSDFSNVKNSLRCGTLYKDKNNGGDALPFYDNQSLDLIDLNGFSWNDTVSSIVRTSGTACEHFTALENSNFDSGFQRRLAFLSQFPDLSAYSAGNIDNKITFVDTKGNDEAAIKPDGTSVPMKGVERLLEEVVQAESYGHAYACALIDDVCNNAVFNASNLTQVLGYQACAKWVSAATLGAVATAAVSMATTSTGGLTAAATTALAGITRTQVLKAAGCMGGIYVLRKAAVDYNCVATMKTWCDSKVPE